MRNTILLTLVTLMCSCNNETPKTLNNLENEKPHISTAMKASDFLFTNGTTISDVDTNEAVLNNFDIVNDLESSKIISLGKLEKVDREEFLDVDSFIINVDIQTKINGVYQAQIFTSQMKPISNIVTLQDGVNSFVSASRAVLFDNIFLHLTNINGVPVAPTKLEKSNCFKGYDELTNDNYYINEVCPGTSIEYFIRVIDEYENIVKKSETVRLSFLYDEPYKTPYRLRRDRQIVFYEALGTVKSKGTFYKDQNVSIRLGNISLNDIYEENSVNQIHIDQAHSIKLESVEYFTSSFIGLYSLEGKMKNDLREEFDTFEYYVRDSSLGPITGIGDFGQYLKFRNYKHVKMDVYVK